MVVYNIRNYLLQDLTIVEKQSYLNYIRGNRNSTEWMEKTLIRRNHILTQNPVCQTCSTPIGINERGNCICRLGHNCNDHIRSII